MQITFAVTEAGFELRAGTALILLHSTDSPAFELGIGVADVDMCRGNFRIEEQLVQRVPLDRLSIDGHIVTLSSTQHPEFELTLTVALQNNQASLKILSQTPGVNRI